MRKNALSHLVGEGFVLASCVLLAGATVATHHLTIKIHPLLMAFYTFVFTILVFYAIKIRTLPKLYSQVRQCWRPALYLNFSTAIDWLLTFIALKYISGSMVNSIIFGIAPIAAFILSLRSYSTKKTLILNTLTTSLILLTLTSLTIIYYRQACLQTNHLFIVFAVVLCLISGIATSCTAIFSKQMSRAGFTAIDILKSRFFLLIIVSIIYLVCSGLSFRISTGDLFVLFALAVGFVILPCWLIQKGIERTSPLSVVITSASIPPLTYFFQLIEVGIRFNLAEFLIVLFLSMLLVCMILKSQPKADLSKSRNHLLGSNSSAFEEESLCQSLSN